MNEDENEFSNLEPQAPREEEALVDQDNDQILRLENETKEIKDKYMRLLAESENQRKRLQKEKIESTRYALGNLASEFLQPLDHLENALKHADLASSDVKQWALGFRMILDQFKEVLNQNGILAFESVGAPFDPSMHEAIDTVEREDVPPGTILSEFQRGYRLEGRVIRPAKVLVAKNLETNQRIEDQDERI